MRLEGKVAIVTGGANGMGAAEAKLFTKEGARVAIADILEAEGRRIEAEITEAGGEAIFVPMDVSNEEDWSKTIEQTIARFGRVDILVNNAGYSKFVTFLETGPELWHQMISINLLGPIHMTHTVLTGMAERRAGVPREGERGKP
mgnify:CR=1 FL=1